jgi:putative transcription factor
MEHQDWKPVVWKKDQTTKQEKIQRQNPAGTSKFLKLDSDDPEPSKVISQEIRMRIQKGRMAKKLTQKQLAQQLNIPVVTVTSYESGKAFPNKAMLRKISKSLAIKL